MFGKCIKDDPENPIFHYKYTDHEMTRQRCREICTSGYYVYFGLENGTDCLCGNKIDDATYVSILECNKPCSGNIFEFCGGASRLNVLKVETKCEKLRRQALLSGLYGRYVPQCWT